MVRSFVPILFSVSQTCVSVQLTDYHPDSSSVSPDEIWPRPHPLEYAWFLHWICTTSMLCPNWPSTTLRNARDTFKQPWMQGTYPLKNPKFTVSSIVPHFSDPIWCRLVARTSSGPFVAPLPEAGPRLGKIRRTIRMQDNLKWWVKGTG